MDRPAGSSASAGKSCVPGVSPPVTPQDSVHPLRGPSVRETGKQENAWGSMQTASGAVVAWTLIISE
jgi:hypothetical protein